MWIAFKKIQNFKLWLPVKRLSNKKNTTLDKQTEVLENL